eukprot:636268_1
MNNRHAVMINVSVKDGLSMHTGRKLRCLGEAIEADRIIRHDEDNVYEQCMEMVVSPKEAKKNANKTKQNETKQSKMITELMNRSPVKLKMSCLLAVRILFDSIASDES